MASTRPTFRPATSDPARTQTWNSAFYWAATGLFVLIFGYSAVWSLVDPVGTRIDTVALGWPEFTAIPLAIAKILGLVAILTRRSRLLVGLAFAGFFYDVLLALSTHLVQADLARASLAALGMVATVAAYAAYRQRFPDVPTS